MHSYIHLLDLWLEKRLSCESCDTRSLYIRISMWKNGAAGLLITLIMGIATLIFFPKAKEIIEYSFSVVAVLGVPLIVNLIFPKNFLLMSFLMGLGLQVITFYSIIKMGGIATSGGIIFGALINVVGSIIRQKAWYTVMMFFIFVVLMILTVVLKPLVHVSDPLSPAISSAFFIMVLIMLSGPMLLLLLGLIRKQQEFEAMEARHLKELNEIKEKLFINITHEFRTPLTVINGMADLIKSQPEQWAAEGTRKIKNNSNILLRMVSQMLDLAKIDAGAMKVNLVRGDINKYLAYLSDLFESEALKKKIELNFDSAGKSFEMDFDSDKLMHIFSNLISNALKFTPEGGKIEVSTDVSRQGTKFLIMVKDSGIGIENEHLGRIFDRFYQAESGTLSGGTGVGLSFTKEMVEVMGGSITVESVYGKGTEFTVALPITRTAPEADFMVTDLSPASSGFHLSSDVGGLAELPLLLVVEDNEDVVQYLQAILKSEYRIEVAGNGKEGLRKAFEIIPDIILSDVMMPGMDGIRLLDLVKADIRTSHVPVVILSARADIDSRLQGLERGADAYLAKPFEERELHIQLKNLVNQRKILHDRYALHERIPETSDKFLKREDDFMTRIRNVMEANLRDDEFGVSDLCSEMAVSRAQLYRKFRSLSDRTISDYFKSLRLYKARELLSKTEMNVTEVTYTVGFKSLSYFSREFAREFGISPSEFRK